MVNGTLETIFPIYQIMNYIFDSDITSSEKLLAIALLQFYNQKTSRCFPGIRALSDCTSMSKSTIMTAIDKLVKNGFIEVEKGNQKKSNNYKLLYVTCTKIRTGIGTGIGTELKVI